MIDIYPLLVYNLNQLKIRTWCIISSIKDQRTSMMRSLIWMRVDWILFSIKWIWISNYNNNLRNHNKISNKSKIRISRIIIIRIHIDLSHRILVLFLQPIHNTKNKPNTSELLQSPKPLRSKIENQNLIWTGLELRMMMYRTQPRFFNLVIWLNSIWIA